MADDGKHNGSQGVMFVSSHDNGPPPLGNVGYAYTLMMPGNAIVYTNGHEFGTNRSFPVDGRGDAIGGTYGNKITDAGRSAKSIRPRELQAASA